jgi:hypothetical protein
MSLYDVASLSGVPLAIVVAHKINFDMLKMINDIETVERIRGTYSGGGMASIGPVYD